MAHTFAALTSVKGRRFRLTDFVLRWGGRKRQNPEEQLRVFTTLARRQEYASVHDR